MKIKQITPFIILLLIISLSASCSLDNANVTSNKEQQIKAFRAEVEALAKEYGVGVYINEDVWAKKLPTMEDIEKDFINIKKLTEKIQMSDAIVDEGNISMATDEFFTYKPKIMKSGIESQDPISGNFSSTAYEGNFEITVDVDWRWGGSLYSDYVDIEGTRLYVPTYEETHLVTRNVSFTFQSQIPNFVAYFDLYENDYFGFRICAATLTYNHSTGTGVLMLYYR